MDAGGIYGCGCKEVYIDYLIFLIPTPLVHVLFCSIPTFFSFKKNFFVRVQVYTFCNKILYEKNFRAV